MAKGGRSDRGIRLEYSFDRLWVPKMVQVYQILIPDKIWPAGAQNEEMKPQRENQEYETGSDLRASVLGETKR
jgi:hypothetical protein